MELTDTFIKNKQAELYLKYKQQLDETSIVILTILSEKIEQSFERQNRKLDNTVDDSQRLLQTDYRHPLLQAFWLGMGKFGFALTALIISISIFYGIYLYNRNEENYDTKQLKWYQQQFYNDAKNHYTPKQRSEYLKKYPSPPQ